MENTRIIKRYANRKLYDTKESSYVTLKQIADYIHEGEEVKIIDNTTQEDLTGITLAQIIYEQEKLQKNRTVGSLRNMIQEGSGRLMSSLREGAVGRFSKDMIEDLQKLTDERLRALITGAIAPVHKVQEEMVRMAKRIEDLEGKLESMAHTKKQASRAASGGVDTAEKTSEPSS